jgi:hypothetical protein
MSRPILVRNLVGQDGEGGELQSPLDLSSSLNYIMNSNFDITQRGTSFTNPVSSSYTLDRWQMSYDGSGQTFSVQQQTLTPGQIPTSASNSMYVSQSVAPSGQTFNNMYYFIEDVNTLQGQMVTFSFYATCNEDMVNIGLVVGRNYGSGGSDAENIYGNTFQAISGGTFGGFTRFSFTFLIPTVAGKTLGSGSYIYFGFQYPLNTTFNYYVTSLMLNAGVIEAPHALMGRTIGGELSFCQRYYETSYNLNVPPGSVDPLGAITGFAVGSVGIYPGINFRIPKRVPPTITCYSVNGTQGGCTQGGGADAGGTGGTPDTVGERGCLGMTGFSGLSSGSPYYYQWTANAEF